MRCKKCGSMPYEGETHCRVCGTPSSVESFVKNLHDIADGKPDIDSRLEDIDEKLDSIATGAMSQINIFMIPVIQSVQPYAVHAKNIF